jgi:hypothetical protein
MTGTPRTHNQITAALNDVRNVLNLLTPTAVERTHHRLTDARRGFPTGHEPPAPDPDGAPPHTDRTGTLATTPDQIEADIRQWCRLTLQLWTVAANLAAIHHRYGTPPAEVRWCTSCQRDGGHLEPIAAGRYHDVCRWCGEMRALNGQLPPMELLRAHRRSQPITQQMLDRHRMRLPKRAKACG